MNWEVVVDWWDFSTSSGDFKFKLLICVFLKKIHQGKSIINEGFGIDIEYLP